MGSFHNLLCTPRASLCSKDRLVLQNVENCLNIGTKQDQKLTELNLFYKVHTKEDGEECQGKYEAES